MHRPPDLPDYRRPPIDEVAIGVQYPIIPGFSEAHIGIFWQQLRAEYPRVESRPRLESPIEPLERVEPTIAPRSINLAPPSHTQGRTWIISEDDVSLVQIQNSLFMHNWRRRESEYPRFEQISAQFISEFERFQSMLSEENLPLPQVEQLELSYFNWIADMPAPRFLRPAQVSRLEHGRVGPDPEDQTWIARYPLFTESRERAGRLHVSCQPAFRMGQSDAPTQGNQLTLTVKLPVESLSGTEDMVGLFWFAREVIVQSFSDLTTEEAHGVWERVQ